MGESQSDDGGNRRHVGYSIDRWPVASERRSALAAWPDPKVAESYHNHFHPSFLYRPLDPGDSTYAVNIGDHNDYELHSEDGAVSLHHIDGKTHILFLPTGDPSFINNVKLTYVLKQHDHVLTSRCIRNAGEVLMPPKRIEAKHFVWVIGVLVAMLLAMCLAFGVVALNFNRYLKGNRELGCDNNRKAALITHTAIHPLCKEKL